MSGEDNADTDEELMIRLQGGQDHTLNQLMDRWQEPLIRFIVRYIGNHADALDLAQESFVRIFENRHSFDRAKKFSPWLYAIAINLCRHYCRWRRNHPTVPIDSEEESKDIELPSREKGPAETTDSHEVSELVRSEIQKLPHDLRTVILLFEYEELSYEAISTALGCTPKAVETRLYRARHVLRKALAKVGLLSPRSPSGRGR